MKTFATIFILSCAAASAAIGAGAQATAPANLRPKFAPGQVLRYQMELITTTSGESGGAVQDPQGPSKLIVTWDATVRIEILPSDVVAGKDPAPSDAAQSAQAGTSPAALRLRMTYEKSSAMIQSDGYDPTSHSIQDQYQNLQGHAVEFALNTEGKVTSISGGDDVFATPQAARDAQAWVAQLSSGVGPSVGSVGPGQQWSSDEPAAGIPLPDMTWHTDSNYLRNEPCALGAFHAAGADSSSSANAPEEICAVIDTRVTLVPSKATEKAEDKALQNSAAQSNSNSAASSANVPKGLHTSGTWTGSSESLIYVSLRTGWVASIAQNGDEQMDVTVITDHLDSVRYAGTVHSHVDLLLLPN